MADGEQLWTLIEGLEANQLIQYTHLLTGGRTVLGAVGCRGLGLGLGGMCCSEALRAKSRRNRQQEAVMHTA